MRRILIIFIILLALLAVMALGMSGTGAWFTDEAVLESNSISTGSFDLVISDVAKTVLTLEPGADYLELLRFCAHNGGTYDMKWRGMFSNVQAPAGLADLITFKAVVNPGGLAGNYGPSNTTWFTDVPASSLMAPNPSFLLDTAAARVFKPGDFICFSLQARLDKTAGNDFSEKSFTANFKVEAVQWINAAWEK